MLRIVREDRPGRKAAEGEGLLPWAGAGFEAGGGMVCTQTFTCVGANSRARACL